MENVFYFILTITSATKLFFYYKVALDMELIFFEEKMFRSQVI